MAGAVANAGEDWNAYRKYADNSHAGQCLFRAVQSYARSADHLPRKASDLPGIYRACFFPPADFPKPEVLGHQPSATAFVDRPASTVTVGQSADGDPTFTLNKGAIKDTGQWVFVTGETESGGSKVPYCVIYFDCMHKPSEKGLQKEYDAAGLCPGGVIMSTGRGGAYRRWRAMLEKGVFEKRNATPTEETAKQVRSAISIYYGDQEGVYPPWLDYLIPMYLEDLPGGLHYTYDPLTGEVGIRPRRQ
jgi:hypothetical protein